MPLDIRDESTGEDLVLSLFIEGTHWARARADGDSIEQLRQELGRSREDIEKDLRSALERLHANELEKVTLNDLRENPPGSLRFVASYVFRDHREVSEGAVKYDVNTGVTEPSHVSALVRNKLRYTVHERLVKGNPNAEALLNVFR